MSDDLSKLARFLDNASNAVKKVQNTKNDIENIRDNVQSLARDIPKTAQTRFDSEVDKRVLDTAVENTVMERIGNYNYDNANPEKPSSINFNNDDAKVLERVIEEQGISNTKINEVVDIAINEIVENGLTAPQHNNVLNELSEAQDKTPPR